MHNLDYELTKEITYLTVMNEWWSVLLIFQRKMNMLWECATVIIFETLKYENIIWFET